MAHNLLLHTRIRPHYVACKAHHCKACCLTFAVLPVGITSCMESSKGAGSAPYVPLAQMDANGMGPRAYNVALYLDKTTGLI